MATPDNSALVKIVPFEAADVQQALLLDPQASLQAVYESPFVIDLLRKTLDRSLTWQFRNVNTVEKVLQAPGLAPEFVAALLALGVHVTTSEGEVWADELHLPLPTGDASVSSIRVPTGVSGRVWSERRVARTPADFPIVAAVAVVDLDDGLVMRARLALTGAWRARSQLARASRLLVGHTLSDERIQRAAQAVAEEVCPRDDLYASAEYRTQMASVLTRRVLEDCRKGAPAND